MSDQQAPVEQTEPTPTQTEAAPEAQAQTQPDPMEQLSQRLDQLGGNVEQLLQFVQPQEDLGFDPSQYQDPYQAQQDPYQQEQAFDPNDPASVQAAIQQGIQQAVGPLQQQMYQQQMGEVFKQYPDIQNNPDVQKAVLSGVQQLGYDPRRDMVPPQAVVLSYKAYKADQIAQQQQPVQPQTPAPNEQGGATPAGQEPDPADEWLGPRPNRPTDGPFSWAQR